MRLQFSAVRGSAWVDREILRRTHEVMRSDGLSYRNAMEAVLASDVDLAARYRREHSRELPEDCAR